MLDLLILADIHYVEQAQHTCLIPKRRAELGLELVRRAWNRAVRHGMPNAVVLMGDLVDNGNADGAEKDLARIHEELASKGVPVLVVPGNHDGDYERLFRIFALSGVRASEFNLRCIRSWERKRVSRRRLNSKALTPGTLLTFADPYGPDDRAERLPEDLALLAQTRRDHLQSPIIAFQHSPIHPPIESTYPYMLGNREEVMAAYAQAGVALSVSGHYHAGQPLSTVEGVGYVTAPALCEAPFRFLRLRFRNPVTDSHGTAVVSVSSSGNSPEFRVEEVSLAMDAGLGLVDHHAHTQFAYCGEDITAETVIARAREFGLAGITFAEHAGQLYLSREDYWRGAFLDDPGIIARERAAGRDRMQRYRDEVLSLRSDFVRVGLEVECDRAGNLTLLDEDRDGWDTLVGAVHYLRELRDASASAAEVNRAFMAANERLCAQGIAVLAHPFRIFRRNKRPTPTELYEPLADLLAATGVAAEVNFHTNEPDPRFFEMCLQRGVRIALASDAHALHEVGEFAPHLELLRRAGAPEDLTGVLF